MKNYTWVEAIRQVMEDNNGVASLKTLYENIGKYRDYSNYEKDSDWHAALRGHLYREIKKGQNFKKIGLAVYALEDVPDEGPPSKEDTVRMHSYIQGVCIEIGNLSGFETYTADPSQVFKKNISLHQLSTVPQCPGFTYDRIVQIASRIDVIWFSRSRLAFPKKAIEVVHSVGTLYGALNRMSQLVDFDTKFLVVGLEEHNGKFHSTIKMRPYLQFEDRFYFKCYEEIIESYEIALRREELKDIFT